MGNRVRSIWGFWDCPRSGIADFNGEPHFFECTWEVTVDNYSEVFVIKELTESLVALASEYDAIWERWKVEYDAGHLSRDTHPAIEGNNRRFLELQVQIDSETAKLREVATAIPEFRGSENGRMEVSWRDAA